MERNETAWRIVQEFPCYGFKEKEKDLLLMVLLRSKARNRAAALIPTPVKQSISLFIDTAPQNFKDAFDTLCLQQIIRVKEHPKAWEIEVLPPPWPKRPRKIKAAERRKVLRDLEASIGHLQPELPGLIGVLFPTPQSEAHYKTGEERPSCQSPLAEFQQNGQSTEIQQPVGFSPTIASPEFQQTAAVPYAPASLGSDEIQQTGSPLKSSQSFSSSKLSTAETLKALKADQAQTRALSPAQKRLRSEVLAALTPHERMNWGGRWTNWIKVRADVVERALADYREESKRVAMHLRDPISSPGGFMADFVKRVAPDIYNGGEIDK